jgi:hypothetical protein
VEGSAQETKAGKSWLAGNHNHLARPNPTLPQPKVLRFPLSLCYVKGRATTRCRVVQVYMEDSRKTEKGGIDMSRLGYNKREIEGKTSKKRLVFCAFCGKPFETTGKRRRFCCPHHRETYFVIQSLRRKFEAGELEEWRVGLLQRLEAFMAKERSKVAAELKGHINNLLEDQKEAGERVG